MKIINFSIGAIVAIGLMGCEPSAPPEEKSVDREVIDATIPKQAVPVVSAYTPWICPANPGIAPKGELTAERIESANNLRSEPGLYEGPVWINDALYFSDFNFEQGFPSRIQR